MGPVGAVSEVIDRAKGDPVSLVFKERMEARADRLTLFGFPFKISTICLPLSCPTVSPLPSSLPQPDEVDESDLSHSSSSYGMTFDES